MIYHFQNHCYQYFLEFCTYLLNSKIKIPSEVQIITCSNDETSSILIQQLKSNNIPYINKVPQGIKWDNRNKIRYILDALEKVTTKYVLILDANDVLIEGDLQGALNVFFKKGKKLIYNATCTNYPKVKIGIVRDRKNRGKFKYLNAGCCIGYTKYAKSFYQRALKYINIDNPWKSEQYIIRHAFRDRRRYVEFDWESKIFQTVGGCIVLRKGNIWKVV